MKYEMTPAERDGLIKWMIAYCGHDEPRRYGHLSMNRTAHDSAPLYNSAPKISRK